MVLIAARVPLDIRINLVSESDLLFAGFDRQSVKQYIQEQYGYYTKIRELPFSTLERATPTWRKRLSAIVGELIRKEAMARRNPELAAIPNERVVQLCDIRDAFKTLDGLYT